MYTESMCRLPCLRICHQLIFLLPLLHRCLGHHHYPLDSMQSPRQWVLRKRPWARITRRRPRTRRMRELARLTLWSWVLSPILLKKRVSLFCLTVWLHILRLSKTIFCKQVHVFWGDCPQDDPLVGSWAFSQGFRPIKTTSSTHSSPLWGCGSCLQCCSCCEKDWRYSWARLLGVQVCLLLGVPQTQSPK